MDDGGGGGGTDGSLNLPGGVGLKLGAPGLTAGPDDENGVGAWGGAGVVGRKEGGSDPATGPVVEKGVIVCAAAGAAAKGEEVGLEGKFGRVGFSVPIDRLQNNPNQTIFQLSKHLFHHQAEFGSEMQMVNR